MRIKHGEKMLELDLFNGEPLIVGEVTTYLASPKEAEKETEKLLERVRAVENIYGRRAEIKVMAVANLEKEASKVLEKLSEKHGILLLR